MAVFTWIPFYDSDWVTDSIMRNNASDGKMLPFVDGSDPYPGHEKVSWADIKSGDVLFLAAHGRKWTTENVAWRQKNGTLVQWTAASFAQAIYDRLDTSASLGLDYRLLACFGANNITPFAESFGARLAKEMKVRRMRGTLTALKGATGMLGSQGKQIGSSRITCALSIFRHGTYKKASAAGSDTGAAGKSWNL